MRYTFSFYIPVESLRVSPALPYGCKIETSGTDDYYSFSKTYTDLIPMLENIEYFKKIICTKENCIGKNYERLAKEFDDCIHRISEYLAGELSPSSSSSNTIFCTSVISVMKQKNQLTIYLTDEELEGLKKVINSHMTPWHTISDFIAKIGMEEFEVVGKDEGMNEYE